MDQLTPQDAAAMLRHAVAALSARMPVEPGDLVPEAGVSRLVALADALEHGRVPAAGADAVPALDAWIRVADSFTLHPDAAEDRARVALAAQLRAVRALVAPSGPLTLDSRDASRAAGA